MPAGPKLAEVLRTRNNVAADSKTEEELKTTMSKIILSN